MAGNDVNTKLLLHANGGDSVKSAFAHVKCNEVSGTNVEDTGSGANTFTASTDTSNLTVAGKGGPLNTAFSLNGSSEYIDIDTLEVDLSTDTSGSFSIWFNVVDATVAGHQVVFAIGDTDINKYARLMILSSRHLQFYFNGATGVDVWQHDSNSNIQDNTWYHVSVVQDGVSPKIYLNGSDVTNLTVTTNTAAWFADYAGYDNGRIGCQNQNSEGNTKFFGGQVDDFRYFQNAVLSQTEVDYLYASGSGTETSIIVDSSVSGGHTAVQTVADAQLDTAVKKWGTASLLFDGTGDYVTIPDSADWDIIGDNTDSQTVDLQVKHTDYSGQETYIQHNEGASNYWRFIHSGAGSGLQFRIGSSDGTLRLDGGKITDSNWHHAAIIKTGAYYGLYLDGANTAFTWDPVEVTFTAPLTIAAYDTGSNPFDGNIDEPRVQADNYFSAAPNSYPAAPLLLYGEGVDEATTMDNDGYSGAVTMVGGAKLDDAQKKFNATTSMFFDGISDYLTVVDTSGTDYDVAGSLTDSWTVDLWIRPDDVADFNTYLMQSDGASDKWQFYTNGSGGIVFNARNAGGSLYFANSAAGAVVASSWQHIAMVKAETNIGVYVDGVQVAYASQAGVDTFVSPVHIGHEINAATREYYGGYMEQVQITKGNKFGASPVVGLTDTITVPTAVLLQDTITEPVEEYSQDIVAVGKSQAVIIA